MCQDIKRESPDEGPDQPGFDTDRDRRRSRRGRARVWLRISDPEVRPTVSSSRAVTTAPTAASSRVIGRVGPRRSGQKVAPDLPGLPTSDRIGGDVSREVSHGPADRATVVDGPGGRRRVPARPDRRLVSRETRRAQRAAAATRPQCGTWHAARRRTGGRTAIDGRIRSRESAPGRPLSGPDDRLRKPERRRRQDHDGGQPGELPGARR